MNKLISGDDNIYIESLEEYQSRKWAFAEGWECAVKACEKQIKECGR